MRSPLPTNLELLIYLANSTGYSYEQVYTIWAEFYLHSESYLITETVLGIARQYQLPIQAAGTGGVPAGHGWRVHSGTNIWIAFGI